MSNSIDAQGNVVTYKSNITEREMGASSRDVTSEKIQKGKLSTASTYIPNHEMNNNLDIIERDGARIHSGGQYQDTDRIMIDGMELEVSTARDLGLFQGDMPSGEVSNNNSPKVSQGIPEEADTEKLEGAELLKAQVDIATNGNSERVLDVFASDIITNDGQLSESGIAYAKDKLGMNEDSVVARVEEMTEFGCQALHKVLETGDNLGTSRVEFLVDRYEHGSPKEAEAVASLWAKVALGRLSDAQVIAEFDRLVAPYDQ